MPALTIVTPQIFIQGMRQLASGVTLITTDRRSKVVRKIADLFFLAIS